jgi:hypothetical protein
MNNIYLFSDLNAINFSLEEPSFDYNLTEEDYIKVRAKLTNLLNSITECAVVKYAQLVSKSSSAKYVLFIK